MVQAEINTAGASRGQKKCRPSGDGRLFLLTRPDKKTNKKHRPPIRELIILKWEVLK